MGKRQAEEDRIPRTPHETRQKLRDAISLLMFNVAGYDEGKPFCADGISNSLRMLLHHTDQGKHKSLLQQLRLRSGRFYTTAPPRIPDDDQLPSQCGLFDLQVTEDRADFLPRVVPLENKSRVPFEEWWNVPVLRGHDGTKLSRRDIVLAMADMDGSHADPAFEKRYARLRSGELLGWQVISVPGAEGIQLRCSDAVGSKAVVIGFVKRDGEEPPSLSTPGTTKQYLHSPQYACIRTIAHELLLTLQKYVPAAFATPYEPPQPYRLRNS